METDSPPPLDLSLKHSVPSKAAVAAAAVAAAAACDFLEPTSRAESLNMLADMQRRFLDSTANFMPTNYTDKLQRVATGPTLPTSSQASEPAEAAAASIREAIRSGAPPGSGAGYESLYQLWMKQYVENYELYHCLQALCSYPVPPQLLLPPPPPPPPPVGSLVPNGDAGGALSPSLVEQRSPHTPLPSIPDLTGFLPKEMAAAAAAAAAVNARPPMCSPEQLGLSLRGNQKYSAFYQQHHGSARLAAAAAAAAAASATVDRPGPVPTGPASHHPKKAVAESFLKSKIGAVAPAASLLPEKTSPKEAATAGIGAGGLGVKSGTSPAVGNGTVLPEKSGLETGFDCSCGKSFENLYNFTVHLKETNHQPRSVHNERDIPKLVRGQDMWINSETEQTREILRCMRCQQSFRTLPDLTMHMMETGHYSEIVYNDSGRCVYVNSTYNREEKKAASAEKRNHREHHREELKRKESHSGRDPAPVHKKMIKLEEVEEVVKPPPPPPPVVVPPAEEPEKKEDREEQEEKDDGDNTETPPEAAEEVDAASDEVRPSTPPENADVEVEDADVSPASKPTSSSGGRGQAGPKRSKEVSEADSATEPSPATSVLQQIETFVERNLPKDPVKKKPSIGLLPCDKTSASDAGSTAVCVSTTPATDGPPYLAPDNPSGGPDENPLSSLQKLVETTEKSGSGHGGQGGSVKAERGGEEAGTVAVKRSDSAGADASGVEMEAMADSSESDACPLSVSAPGGGSFAPLSQFVAPSPTVIMVNPTYIYQPAFPPPPPPPPPHLSSSLFSPATYPWYSAFPLCSHLNSSNSSSPSRPAVSASDALTATSAAISSSSSSSAISTVSSAIAAGLSPTVAADAIDLSQVGKPPSSAMTATSVALAAAAAAAAAVANNNKDSVGLDPDPDKASATNGAAGPGSVVQKKAKCNYCGKPFANKGQVRLHVSKGKCPSLAASPRCKSANSLFSPTLRLPIDAKSSSEVEEKLKVYYNLAKQLSKENSE